MFIIEGSDNLGKTTAAKRLVQLAAERAAEFVRRERSAEPEPLTEELFSAYPVRYAHMSRPNASFDFFRDYTDMMSVYAVQDRFHLGALVWHENVLQLSTLRLIEARLMMLGSFTVVMTCDNDLYPEVLRMDTRKQPFSHEELIQANHKFYEMGIGMHRLRPIVDLHYHASSMVDLYPTDSILNSWLDAWYERLLPIPRFV